MHGLYQQFLSSLASAGVLIGVASRMISRSSRKPSRARIYCSKKKTYFVEVHWNAKSESVQRILKLWNIGQKP